MANNRPRIGFGYDVHRLTTGRELWLGGVRIDHQKGLDGHSDADVLLHAICDALLGAAGLRDIGYHFPDTDERLKNIDSKILLKQTAALLAEKGVEIGNIDCMLCAEAPKIAPYIEEMKQTIAQTLNIAPESISIKAGTAERMGFVGREEGMAAYAVAMIF
ncbi:MAG: 2-C-methyl-D-erythritol 2,4-cyclodiphosphate synthase [Prevotellaceae bacterium]|jgi:2-C-methyl-D-erythritol 2,4-cyclodiphosphate synthase|nr:2-C-methyl-D-erythritol 2,4-cyclodiphosphate synthase [Prevotellaceae bacterium]